MSEHEGQLQFRQLSKCWYGEACLRGSDYTDQVSFGLYYPEWGCYSEALFKWFDLGWKSTPRIELFSDGWRLFRDAPGLALALADINDTDPNPEEICSLLAHIGFTDTTEPNMP